jgi:hypothetical protein
LQLPLSQDDNFILFWIQKYTNITSSGTMHVLWEKKKGFEILGRMTLKIILIRVCLQVAAGLKLTLLCLILCWCSVFAKQIPSFSSSSPRSPAQLELCWLAPWAENSYGCVAKRSVLNFLEIYCEIINSKGLLGSKWEFWFLLFFCSP